MGGGRFPGAAPRLWGSRGSGGSGGSGMTTAQMLEIMIDGATELIRKRHLRPHTGPVHLPIWIIRAFRACITRAVGRPQVCGSLSMTGHGERSAMFTIRLNAKVLSLPEDSTAADISAIRI